MLMPEDISLTERLQSALRTPPGDGGDLAMTAALRARHPADIAEAMGELARPEALAVFNWLDNARAAEVLDELDPELVRFLLDNAPAGRLADLLDRLPMDDAAEVIDELENRDPERAQELLDELEVRSPEDAAEVRELLAYPDQSAGRLMTDKFVRLRGPMSVDEAFTAVRRADPEVETLNDLFVVTGTGEKETLVGVVSLRDLVRARTGPKVSDIMVKDPIVVTVDTDQEEVARIISKYDFLSVPVLDREGYLAGIVTVDDIVDVLVEEQTEDVLKQGAVEPGVINQPYFTVPILKAVRSRVTWLVLLFAAETLTTSVLQRNEEEIARVPGLAVYIPLLVGTGGNTGAQTVSTVIRGMALGEIRWREAWRVLLKEAFTGAILGLLLCVIAFGRALMSGRTPSFALVVALTVWAICAWANVIGALVPLAAQKLKMDPALVSAPLITTLVDASGLAIYLAIARWLLTELR